METPDAVIIGGGIIGCAAAYYLAARGIRPVILERRGLATEASGATAGVVGASAGIPGKTLAHTKKSLELLARDAEELGRPVELVVAAGAWSRALLAPLDIGLPVRPGRGQMLVTDALPPLTPRVLRTPETGIRQDVRGHVLIGSAVEDVGYNHEVTLPTLGRFARL